MKPFEWSRLLILGIATALAVSFAAYVDQLERQRTQAFFDNFADDGQAALINRVEGYVRTLDGASGLFAASTLVTAQDWRRYVGDIDPARRLPGVLGVGYISLLRGSADLDVDAQKLHNGLVLPRIHPDTGRDERFVVQFIEPLDDNRGALGLDMGFEPVRRAVAQRARDTNTVQLTPPIVLVQANEEKSGFLLLRPVFERDVDHSNSISRDKAFQGWTYMAFLGDSLFASLTAQHDTVATLQVVDGEAEGFGQVFTDRALGSDGGAQFQATREIELFGRSWTMIWNSTPAFEASHVGIAKWTVLVLGLLVVGLLAVTMRMISRREKRIEWDVAKKTKELRAKTEETQSVIDNAVLSIFVLDEDGLIISANQAANRLFGDANTQVGAPLANTLQVSKVVDEKHPNSRKAIALQDPALRLMVEKNTWYTATGQLRKTLLVHDVSDAEESAKRLRDTEERWNLALAGAQIGVFDINLATQTSIVSDTWRDLMQVPDDLADSEAQALFLKRIHPDDIAILRQADEDCIKGLTERSIAEYRIKFPDGRYRWMRSNAVIVEHSADGKALRLLGAQTDVTELHEAQESLQASRERFELMLEEAPVGMALFNIKGNFLGANEALSRMTGYTQKEMFGGMKFQDMISKPDMAEIASVVGDLKSKAHSSYQGEYQIVPKSGPAVWGLLSVAWTTDPVMKSDVFIVQINDISEKKNIEKIKSEFVATVSHELRTPLTSIKGALGLMSGPMLTKMPAGADRLLEIATANTDRLTSLVNDILDLEKIGSGEVKFHIEANCIAEQLQQSVEQMLPFAQQHKVQLVLNLPEYGVFANIDAQRTQQLIANLLSNACKYSDDDTPINIRLEVVEGQALVCILNSGPPIPDEFKSRIFRPFSQADASDTRASGGTGLGLNISKQIVTRMGGKIGFQSEAGAPTAFWFTVPLAEVKQKAAPVAEADAVQRPWFNVLHLEDDKDFLEIVSAGLKDCARVTSVLTLKEAKKALLVRDFEVIVVDWELSDGHGSDILDDIARFQPNAKVIALSANETNLRDIRVDREIIKSRTDLDDIVSKVVSLSRRAS